jgi:hypothetical protein
MNLNLLNILQGTILEQQVPEESKDAWGKMLEYISLAFRYINAADIDAEQLLFIIENEGIPNPGDDMWKDYQSVLSGLKVLGLVDNYNQFSKHMDSNDAVYLLVKNYIHNKGKYNNPDEIQLIPGAKWDVEMDAKENMIELLTLFGVGYGDDGEVIKKRIMDDPEAFETDRESYDRDYPENDDGYFGLDFQEMDKTVLEFKPHMFVQKDYHPTYPVR